MKVTDRYVVAVKKEGIIVGDLPRKISCAYRITFAILTSHNSLASLGFALICSLKFLYSTICQSYCIMHDKMERDKVSLGLEFLLYVEIYQQRRTCLLTNGVKIFY